ncbi:MAG: MmgE/PrpD family protein [Elusimicrobia bacterium]|nr:MmgE/PrpD family protein [Elusimicrobiota bacterium]
MIGQVGQALAEVSWAKLSAPAKEKLKHCVIANFSVSVAGLPYARLPEPAASRDGHLLFSGRRTANARDAAFWNAAVMLARTQDEFHPIGNLHAATVMIPAAMAAAEVAGASGPCFLDALAAGYTAAAGLSRAFSPKTTPKGLRSSGLYAPFGAVASAGRIAGLDAAGLGNAVALAASIAGGFTQCWVDGSDEWQLHVAQAAANGLLAVDLTRAGVRGGEHALDGKAGFYHAHAGVMPKFADIVMDFDADHAVLDTVIKRYPVSGICQPIVRLSERIAAKHRLKSEDIERVTVWMNPYEMRYPGTLNKGPFRSFSDVLMSAAFCCASVLACGRFEFRDLFDPRNAARDRLIGVTEVREDAALPTLSCRIEVQPKRGNRIAQTLMHGGGALAIDATSIDAWALELWQEGGRSEAEFRAFRAAVDALERTSARLLLDSLPQTAVAELAVT